MSRQRKYVIRRFQVKKGGGDAEGFAADGNSGSKAISQVIESREPFIVNKLCTVSMN